MKIACITKRKSGHAENTPNGFRVAKALSQIGHEVQVYDHDEAVVRSNLAGHDLALIFGTLVRAEAKASGIFKRVRQALDPSAVMALWYFDLCNPAMKNAPWKYTTMRRIAPALDWLVLTDHSYAWEAHAPRFLHLPQGVDPDDFEGRIWPPEPRLRDVIFTGGIGSKSGGRASLIRLLGRHFRVNTFGPGSATRIYGKDFFLQYQRSRIALVPHPSREAAHDYWSNRIYLATATGTPCVVGYTPGLEAHFEDGKEVVFYRNSRELIEQTTQLVKNPDLRKSIGLAGRARTLAEHTYAKRCETLMGAICA